MLGKQPISTPAAPSRKMSRRDSTGLVRLAETSLVIRRRQNVLSCGLPPTSIDVAQGPKGFSIALLLSGTLIFADPH
jgi:hypothetical protein